MPSMMMTRMLKSCLSAVLLLLVILDVARADAILPDEGTTEGGTDAELFPEKELIFFAGPHQSSEEGVEDFFHHWITSGWRFGHPNLLALKYWRWPATAEDGVYGAHVFQELVRQPSNAKLTSDVLVASKTMFDEAENGIVVGTQYFDQVGHNAVYDAMTPMNKIVDRIGIEDSHVTVILNYRTPRIEHWLSIWKRNNPELTYAEFMCSTWNNKETRKDRMSQLAASMNALNGAYEFLKRGWKVKLIDLEGVHDTNRDVTHVIGCDILKGKCDADGYLFRHDKFRTPDEGIPEIGNEITEQEAIKIEKLFRYRDCGFEELLQTYLDNGQMEVLYKDSIWADCNVDQQDTYKSLASAEDLVYSALLSQLTCDGEAISGIVAMDEALGEGDAAIVAGPNAGGELESFFNHIVVPLVFIAAICVAAYFAYKKGYMNRLGIGGRQGQPGVGGAYGQSNLRRTTMSREMA